MSQWFQVEEEWVVPQSQVISRVMLRASGSMVGSLEGSECLRASATPREPLVGWFAVMNREHITDTGHGVCPAFS